jgi:hypothetical protein
LNILIADVHVAVINESTVVTDAEVLTAINALEIQVHRDFAPVWGINANLGFVPKGITPQAGWWWLTILDDADQAGALGYHDVTTQGQPLGKVFAKTAQSFGASWTVTTSHELLEMLADPEIDLTVFVQATNTSGTIYAYEICDACEADNLGYQIGGVLVSDFVYPAWFESSLASGTQVDYGKHLPGPFALAPGGYIGAYDVTKGSGWQQITARSGSAASYKMRPAIGSRRERRRLPRDQWERSVIHRSAT